MKQTFEAIQTASQYRGHADASQSATRSSARSLNGNQPDASLSSTGTE